MIQYHTERPVGHVIFVSCDSKYLHDHAPAFLNSCLNAGNAVHLHVVNPTDEDVKFMDAYPEESITWSSENKKLEDQEKRTYYACNRFLVAPELLKKTPITSMLITDIDCLIMKHISEPMYALGLFLRDPLPGVDGWERESTRVAAGVVHYHKFALPFAEAVACKIRTQFQEGHHWFTDQWALYQVYQQLGRWYTPHVFDNQFMDWEFVEGTTIWTGKGPRKYDNPKYLAKKKEFEELRK